MISPTLFRMDSKKEQVSFETSLKDLERTVGELEKGDLALEDQLKSFERGVALSRECLKRLDEIERRVEKLVQSADGKLAAVPFQVEETTP